MSLVIGFDLDGTVVDTPTKMIDYLNERLPIKISIEDVKTYCIENALPDEYKWVVDNGFRDSRFWKKVSLIDGAYDAIKRLYDEGHDIYFVTSSLPSNLKKKIGHLTRSLDFFPADYVWQHTVNIHNKQLLRLDVIVDDALFNLNGDREYYSICIDMPYNQTDELIPNFTRVYNWQEMYSAIKMVESLIKENEDEY